MRHTITLSSINPDEYNIIRFTAPITASTKLVNYCVNNLTTMCNIQVLEDTDYIELMVNEEVKKVYFYPYSNIDVNSWVFMVAKQFEENNIKIDASLTDTGILSFRSNNPFIVKDMTYNVKMLSGAYHNQFPMEAKEKDKTFVVTFHSVGFFLSTPILYLLSNNGSMNFSNLGSSSIAMRLNNSFSHGFPIVHNNGDFVITCPSSDLTDLVFTLTDAHYHPIHLLNPMFISIMVEAVPDEPLFNVYSQ